MAKQKQERRLSGAEAMAKVRTLRILVTVAKADLKDSAGLTFTLGDTDGREQRSATAVFVSGEKP